MKCARCGAYMPFSPDTNNYYLCSSCVFQKKQLELQEQILRSTNQQSSQPKKYAPYQWTSNDFVGFIYFIIIFLIGGGIWITAESIFGDIGFFGFLFSMFLGFCTLVGLQVTSEYLKHLDSNK